MQGHVYPYQTVKHGTRWCFTFDREPKPDGSRNPLRRCTFATKRAAQAAMQAQMVARRADDWVEPSAVLLRDHLSSWLDAHGPSLTPSTLVLYRYHAQHLSRELGTVPVGALSLAHVDDAYGAIGQRLAPATLRITHTVLHSCLEHAVRRRMRRDNPAAHASLPALAAAEETVWSPAEAARFLAESADSPDHALWRLLLSTGMRVGEALALSWAHVDLDRGLVRVARTLSKDANEKLVIREGTKTKAGRRTLEVPPEAVQCLRAHKTAQTARRLAAWGWHDEGLVFERGDGRPCWPNTVRRHLAEDCARAGVTVLTAKALRHTAATLMVANGVDMHAVKNRLGHSNISLTMNLYAHATPEADRRASEVLARVLRGDFGSAETEDAG